MRISRDASAAKSNGDAGQAVQAAGPVGPREVTIPETITVAELANRMARRAVETGVLTPTDNEGRHLRLRHGLTYLRVTTLDLGLGRHDGPPSVVATSGANECSTPLIRATMALLSGVGTPV